MYYPPDGKFASELSNSHGADAAQADGLKTLHVEHNFPINIANFSADSYIAKFKDCVDSIAAIDPQVRIEIHGQASIDGPKKQNSRLALWRALALKDWLIFQTSVRSGQIKVTSDGEDWSMLHQLVANDNDIPARDSVQVIINSKLSDDQRESELRKLNNGETWDYMAAEIFPKMRRLSLDIFWHEPASQETTTPFSGITTSRGDLKSSHFPVSDSKSVAVDTSEPYEPHIYIKTNIPAWGAAWSNIAVEADVAPHWSVSLPVYYSGWNYFKHTLKFRTLAIVPEARYWLKRSNTGFFINAHAGCAWYNYAKDGDYRYQDHDGRTPALGGGIGLGYRFNISRNRRWAMEAAIGCGVYRLDYDIFQNRDNGFLLGREKHTFFGIDQAALSISYSFNQKRHKDAKSTASREGGVR